MKYKFFITGFILLVSLGIFVSAVPWWKQTDPCPIKDTTDVVFYGDTGFGGVGDLSRSWIISFLDWWKLQDPSLDYVELDSDDVREDCNLNEFPNLKLYIQPGGNAYYQQRTLDNEGKQKILNFIDSGKAYLGICAGFYYAAKNYYWQDDYYDWPDLLGVYPTVEGSIREIADYDENPGYALTSLDNGFNAIYYGGPTRGYEYTSLDSPGEVIAKYIETGNEMPALIKYNNLLLSSVHLEAYENDGVSGLSTEDRLENYKLLANLINDVAETTFYVPDYTNPPICGNDLKETGEACDGNDLAEKTCQGLGFDGGDLSCLDDCSDFDTIQCFNLPSQCNDGIDNDEDGLIDYPNDPGCEFLEDDDETDITGPVEILFDGFEDGNLNEWSVYGTGKPWSVSTDTSYKGIWSARAKKTGAGDDSFMEILIDVSKYSSVNFEYYRKLVGLDTADDFEVQYFNGIWHSVEHLGTARASDSNFKFKSFEIPNTTTKIRFKCECGAVSEKCYVDNVKIIGE